MSSSTQSGDSVPEQVVSSSQQDLATQASRTGAAAIRPSHLRLGLCRSPTRARAPPMGHMPSRTGSGHMALILWAKTQQVTADGVLVAGNSQGAAHWPLTTLCLVPRCPGLLCPPSLLPMSHGVGRQPLTCSDLGALWGHALPYPLGGKIQVCGRSKCLVVKEKGAEALHQGPKQDPSLGQLCRGESSPQLVLPRPTCENPVVPQVPLPGSPSTKTRDSGLAHGARNPLPTLRAKGRDLPMEMRQLFPCRILPSHPPPAPDNS